ncbi:MAG: helix-turn-helix domain-containing protein [Cyclobacteriaceae bacterium]
MENPFNEISERLERIENILVDQKSMRVELQENEEDKLLNVKEAAQFLGESVATLYGRTCRNQIPFYKRGKKLYFKKPELLSWVEKGRHKTVDEIRHGADKR